tara:strand:+ start:26133 stop:27137 length:1005 start_codon:yes stop_codon:yes gene_type:complete
MIFVTGGNGLVGSHILLKLSQQGRAFKALRRSSSSLEVCKRIFTYYNAADLFSKIHWVIGDINDMQTLEAGFKDCDMILHCAALVSFAPSDLDRLKKINIEGTANIVNLALSQNIKKLGYISSIATLGSNSTKNIIDEECYFKSSNLVSHYAISKYYAEQEVWRGVAEGLDAVIINPSVILGPGDWKKGSSQIFQKIYNGLNYYTSGSTGYVDVDDVAEALLQLMFSNINNERFIVNAANLKYRDCFDKIAVNLKKPKATIKVTPFIKEIAWRIEAIRSFFSGKKPLLTKETANMAMKNRKFSSAKIEKVINFKFTEINSTIKKYSDWFIADLI